MTAITSQLSEHFSLLEATHSSTAARLNIDNSSPSAEVIAAATRTAVKMEKVRSILNKPIHVDSWIRCLELNRALGSKDTSKHILGLAVDFIAPQYGTPLAICQLLIANADLIGYDQLILEHTWVHISFSPLGAKPRNQVLSLLQAGGYANGLTDNKGTIYAAVA